MNELGNYLLFVNNDVSPFSSYNMNKYLGKLIDSNKNIMKIPVINTENDNKIYSYLIKKETYLANEKKYNMIIYNNQEYEDTLLYDYNAMGYKINDNLKLEINIDICILLYQQFENNIFEELLIKISQELKKNICIYLANIPVSKINLKENRSLKIIIRDISEFTNFVLKNNIKKIFILYYPPYYFSPNNTLFYYLNKIDTYVLLAGYITPMNFYAINYPIKKVLTIGTFYSKIYNANQINLKTESLNNFYFKLIFDKMANYGIVKRNNFKLKKKFCHISRLTIEKRPFFLIDSFKLFLETIKDYQYELYIIGPISEEIINYIKFGGLENNILVKEWMSQVELFEFIKSNIDYNINCSLSEGIPSVTLECMYLGIPTISSNIMGSNEIILNEYNGLLFDFEKYEDFNNKIYLHYNEIEERISKWDIENKKNLVKIFIKQHNNQELFDKLNLNCQEYIKNMDYEYNLLNTFDFKQI